MSAFSQFATVRVKALLRPLTNYNSWQVSRRAPVMGDRGAVVEVIRGTGQAEVYVVECVNADGSTEWLAEFSEAELESCESR